MATDEYLLAGAAGGDVGPALRLYTWDPPAVSLGRFQRADEAVDLVACRRLGIDVVRRVTGGRAVLHHRELTYSVVARSDHSFFPNDVLGTYRIIAQGLLAGLRRLGINAEMVSRSGPHAGLVKKDSKSSSCFASPSWYEIVVRGRKIVGSAQRRVSGAFLQHGSILIGYDATLEAGVIAGSAGTDRITWIERELGRSVNPDEVTQAMVLGFSEAWRIDLAGP